MVPLARALALLLATAWGQPGLPSQNSAQNSAGWGQPAEDDAWTENNPSQSSTQIPAALPTSPAPPRASYPKGPPHARGSVAGPKAPYLQFLSSYGFAIFAVFSLCLARHVSEHGWHEMVECCLALACPVQMSRVADEEAPVPEMTASPWKLRAARDTERMVLQRESANDEEVDIPEERDGVWLDWRILWAYTGPGWLMSMAYLDPGNLESDLQSGAYAGYDLLWVLFWATAMGLCLQVLAARLGVVTGLDLAQHCRLHYPRCQSHALWVMTEVAIIGSDIQEVIGSAIAFQTLFGTPLWLGCLATAADTFTFLGLHYFGIRKLEALFAALILTMAACFWINYVQAPPPVEDVLMGTLLPNMPPYGWMQATGIVGAVVMPHNIYLHSALVKSRKIDRTRRDTVATANKYNLIESSAALATCFVINLAVVTVFARAFFNDECASKATNMACLPGLATQRPPTWTPQDGTCTINGEAGLCQEIGLSSAAEALETTLGSEAKYLWAVGLLAAGQASTMTGTLAGQHVMQGFLQIEIAPWLRVLVTRMLALGPAIAVALAAERLGDLLNEWINVLQSMILPFALLPALHFTSSSRIMGEFKNSLATKVMVWCIAIVVIATNLHLVVHFITNNSEAVPQEWWFYSITAVFGVGYLSLIFAIIWPDLQKGCVWLTCKTNHSI